MILIKPTLVNVFLKEWSHYDTIYIQGTKTVVLDLHKRNYVA
jgi:hypothetical protein